MAVIGAMADPIEALICIADRAARLTIPEDAALDLICIADAADNAALPVAPAADRTMTTLAADNCKNDCVEIVATDLT